MTESSGRDGIEIVLLAAGGSSRLGRPKQLECFGGRSLLSHAATEALATGAPVRVVLGSQAERLGDEVEDLPVDVVINQGWEQGVASSIRAGCERMAGDARGVLITLCDQPLVAVDHLRMLMSTFQQGESHIVATAYHGTVGVPAVFDRSHLADLMKLDGDEGARKLIARNMADVQTIEFSGAGIDIDTEADVKNLAEFS